jgi:hypothetical protein
VRWNFSVVFICISIMDKGIEYWFYMFMAIVLLWELSDSFIHF